MKIENRTHWTLTLIIPRGCEINVCPHVCNLHDLVCLAQTIESVIQRCSPLSPLPAAIVFRQVWKEVDEVTLPNL